MAEVSLRTCVIIVIASYALSFGSAKAADNSDCCSNLEDRIAKLESKADKGNEKVSVTVSGWVTKSVDWWSDGTSQSSKPSQQR